MNSGSGRPRPLKLPAHRPTRTLGRGERLPGVLIEFILGTDIDDTTPATTSGARSSRTSRSRSSHDS